MRPYLRSLEIRIKKGYSASLLAFAMERHPYSFAPVAFGEADAGRRIKNVLNFKKPHTWVAAIATVLVALVAVSCLTNQKPSETKTEHTTEKVDSTQQPVQENAGAAIIEQNIREWAQAFCDRDTEKIVQMTSKEVQSNLEKNTYFVDGWRYTVIWLVESMAMGSLWQFLWWNRRRNGWLLAA